MDPEAAVDIMKDAVLEAEKFIKAAQHLGKSKSTHPEAGALTRSHIRSARDLLDEAGEAQGDVAQWVARGGWKPRRYDTWVRRLVRAEQAWIQVSKAYG